jgi:hypothetical protein
VYAQLGRWNTANPFSQNTPVAITAGMNARGPASQFIRTSSSRIATSVQGSWTRMSVIVGCTHTNLSAVNEDIYASVRTAGNAGWTYGSAGAAGSAPNRTHGYRFTLQGVATYVSATGIPGDDNVTTVSGFSFINGSNIRFFNRGLFFEQVSTGSLSSPGTERLLIGAQGPASGPGTYCSLDMDFVYVWDGAALTDDQHLQIALDPWQIWETDYVHYFPVGVTNATGYGTEVLDQLIETATGRTGAVGYASETLQALTESARGLTGAIAGAVETLEQLQESGTGDVASDAVIGHGSETLRAMQEAATGLAGMIGTDTETLQALAEIATGRAGASGHVLETLEPLQEDGYGESGAEPIAPTARGGAPAWWGYEGFDGTKRPWWYRDLKDKARELERLRQERIALGILPPDEDKSIKATVKETLAFAEKIPTPRNAEQMIARAEVITDKIERLVDQMQEDDDEQAIAELSRFFFHRKSESRAWH